MKLTANAPQINFIALDEVEIEVANSEKTE